MSILDQITVVTPETADVAELSLSDLSFDGESPLDRAARDVLSEAGHEVLTSFGNAPRV